MHTEWKQKLLCNKARDKQTEIKHKQKQNHSPPLERREKNIEFITLELFSNLEVWFHPFPHFMLILLHLFCLYEERSVYLYEGFERQLLSLDK